MWDKLEQLVLKKFQARTMSDTVLEESSMLGVANTVLNLYTVWIVQWKIFIGFDALKFKSHLRSFQSEDKILETYWWLVKRSTWKGRSHIIGVLIDLSLSLQYLQNDTLFTSLTSKTHMLKLGLSYKQTIKSDWFWLMFCLKEIEWAKSLTKLEPSSSCLVGLAALPRIP